MTHQSDTKQLTLEQEVKEFLIETLALEEVTPATIESEAPLFGDGLGLDSVDALEIGVALKKQYGIQLDQKDDATRGHFASVRTLARLIATHRSNET